jgi:hypothetical protein
VHNSKHHNAAHKTPKGVDSRKLSSAASIDQRKMTLTKSNNDGVKSEMDLQLNFSESTLQLPATTLAQLQRSASIAAKLQNMNANQRRQIETGVKNQAFGSMDPDAMDKDVGKREDKRMRRLLKNREAAQQFRLRQKAYIAELEKKVQELSTDVMITKAKMEVLTAENKMVKEQLNYLRGFATQVMTCSAPFSSNSGPASVSASAVTPSSVPSSSSLSAISSTSQLPLPPPISPAVSLTEASVGENSTNRLSIAERASSLSCGSDIFRIFPSTSGNAFFSSASQVFT